MVMVSSLSGQTPSFVPGQVLLKFAEGTIGHDAVVAATQSNKVDSDDLASVARALGMRTGIPLIPASIGSGYWMVMRVDTVSLLGQVADWLERRAETRLIEKHAAGGLTLNLVDSVSASQVAQLVEAWSVGVSVPLNGKLTSPRDLTLSIDHARLTLDLVSRLKALPEVASVQPNYAQAGPRP